MPHLKFDISKLERLNDPGRFELLDPDVMWGLVGDMDPRVIVEIGAGTGLFACRFAQMAPDADVWAVDVEPAMIKWMYEHRPGALAGRVKPLLARETSVPLPTGDADLVVMINVHHELADPVNTYREALRLLRIGGMLLAVDWSPEAQRDHPPLAVRADPSQVAEMLESIGFDAVTERSGLKQHWMLTAIKPAVCSL